MTRRSDIQPTILLLGMVIGVLGCAQVHAPDRAPVEAGTPEGSREESTGTIAPFDPGSDVSRARGNPAAASPATPPEHAAQVAGEEMIREETIELGRLEALVEKAMLDFHSCRAAEEGTDFLRRSATRRAFVHSMEVLMDQLKEVSARPLEFQAAYLQERYVAEVKRPFERLTRESRDIMERREAGAERVVDLSGESIHLVLGEVKTLVEARRFAEASDIWANFDGILREPGVFVPPGARSDVAALRELGERARFQDLFAKERLDVQGVVRMEKAPETPGKPVAGPAKPEIVAAAIVNGRIVFPGMDMGRDITFVGLKDDGRLHFTYRGHEVDCLPPEGGGR